MIVYELRHEIYSWEESSTDVYTLLFETEEDAIEYLSIKKVNIIDEYCNHLDLPSSIDALHQYMENDDESYYNEFADEENYFHVELDEFGFDTLCIEKKEVLKFK